MNNYIHKTQSSRTKVGLIGGSFDPVHLGHTAIGNMLSNQTLLSFDEIWFVPDDTPTLQKKLTQLHHRLTMLHLAVSHLPHIKICTYKIDYHIQQGTYAFISHLLANSDFSGYEFYFIVGSDILHNFHLWIKPDDLSDLIPFVILPRVGFTNINYQGLLSQPHHKWELFNSNIVLPEVSSTTIKNQIKTLYHKNASNVTFYLNLQDLLNKDVVNYIYKNQLYR